MPKPLQVLTLAPSTRAGRGLKSIIVQPHQIYIIVLGKRKPSMRDGETTVEKKNAKKMQKLCRTFLLRLHELRVLLVTVDIGHAITILANCEDRLTLHGVAGNMSRWCLGVSGSCGSCTRILR